MELDPALRTYVAEGRELLQDMEDTLLRIEHDADKQDDLNSIFRAAHTIKGSAGLFGLDDIVTFTHGVETVLDQLREGRKRLDHELIALLLSCCDHISDLMDQVELGGDHLTQMLVENGARLTERLLNIGVDDKAAKSLVPQDGEVEVERINGEDAAATDNWHISVRFGSDSLRNGMDPLPFLHYLRTFGQIVAITTLDDGIPGADEMDAESCYLGFEISFKSDADKSAIESVFEFVRADSVVRVLPPRSRIVEYIKLIRELPEEDMYLGEILVRCGSLTQMELDEALTLQDGLRKQNVDQPIGRIVVDNSMITQAVIDAAIEKQSQVREGKSRDVQSIRVDAEKLDKLINLIGELVIAGAGTALSAVTTGDASLIESVSTLTRLMEEVRDSALRLRMVQIRSTFNRFHRVVRDVSRELGKEIDLVITGSETELDKTVVEKIGDPLMHLVRNSMDHGIEPPEVRVKFGKPRAGIVRLNAYHDSGSIVIEVSDDGVGLNRDKILRKAAEKRLVSEGQHLEEHEIYNLIFEPGFSTVDSVTSLSGRGVGMDVVKRNIAALRGTVEVESRAGAGTTFRVRMPLTLAIIDGFLVGVGEASFVVPLDMVLECVELNADSREADCRRDYINLRGEVLPFVRLRDMFDVGGCPPRRENVVVVQYGSNKAGLVVDRLMGEFQTVIKPLGRIFSHVKGVSGSTILGNGEVALILDVLGLVQEVTHIECRAAGTVA